MTTYYDSSEQTFKPIPKAPFYVLSNDSFMSDWGPAKGKINTCVVPCETWYEAERVENYAKSRLDQKRVRIASAVRHKPNVIYSICEGWRDRATNTD